MDVGRQCPDEIGEKAGARRPVGHLVDIVEHQTDVQRSELAEGVEDTLHWLPAITLTVEGDEDGPDEVLGIAIIRLARHPGIDAAGLGPVSPNGLGEQG